MFGRIVFDVERAPNLYIIRIFRNQRIIEEHTIRKAIHVEGWFQCITSMGFNRKITNIGRKYFRENIRDNIDRWIAEDKCMEWAQQKFNEFYGQL